MDNLIKIKEVINEYFPKEKYSYVDAIEELNTWRVVDLKLLIKQLGQYQKGLVRSIYIYIIKDIISASFGRITVEQLNKNPFIIKKILKWN
jgi:hypothetical protein